MKNIFKKWWFWLIILGIIIGIVLIYNSIENKKLEKTFKNMGESASNYYNETKNAKSYYTRN